MYAIPAWFSENFGLSSHSHMVLSPCCANHQQVQYFPSLAVCSAVSPLPPKEPRVISTYSLGTSSGVRNLADPQELNLAVYHAHPESVYSGFTAGLLSWAALRAQSRISLIPRNRAMSLYTILGRGKQVRETDSGPLAAWDILLRSTGATLVRRTLELREVAAKAWKRESPVKFQIISKTFDDTN